MGEGVKYLESPAIKLLVGYSILNEGLTVPNRRGTIHTCNCTHYSPYTIVNDIQQFGLRHTTATQDNTKFMMKYHNTF